MLRERRYDRETGRWSMHNKNGTNIDILLKCKEKWRLICKYLNDVSLKIIEETAHVEIISCIKITGLENLANFYTKV